MERTSLEFAHKAICAQQWEVTKGHLLATVSLAGSGHGNGLPVAHPDQEIPNYNKIKALVDELIAEVEGYELFYF